MEFTDDQIERYSRNLLLKEVGSKGQAKLLSSKVLCLGAGGLGSPAALYLAAAGVGTLGLLDSDTVELHNLQRQILHGSRSLGEPKALSGKARLNDLNPDCRVTAHPERLTAENALSLFQNYDLVLDGSDNFPTRYLANDVCVLLKKPLVSGAILGFEGQATTILPGEGHCYRCLFPDPPEADLVPSCQEAGVLGAVAGVIGSVMATEALKILLGQGSPLSNRLLLFNALNMSFREVSVPRNPHCSACSGRPSLEPFSPPEIPCLKN